MAITHSDLLAAKTSMSRRYLAKAVPAGVTTFGLAAPLKAAQNVVGVGVGTKFSAGKETTTTCVRFYVGQKIGKGALSAKDLLPTEIDGIPTDVIVTGKFRMLDTAADNKKRRRPVRPGTSIGFQFPPPKDGFVMAGTFGAVVTKSGKRFILSNNHVLAENGLISLAWISTAQDLPKSAPCFRARSRLSGVTWLRSTKARARVCRSSQKPRRWANGLDGES